MPASAVEHEDDVFVGAGAGLGGERRQQRAEQRGVDAIGDEPHNLAGGGPDEAVQIEPLVAVVAAGGRTASARCPDLAQDRFQAEAMFIERPDLDRNRRFGALELDDPGLELFLNRACSYRLALGLAGRGTCRVKSRRRRYSTPRCGDTVRPIRPVIQSATLRPLHTIGRRLADHVAQLLQLSRVEQRGGTGIVQPAVAQTRKAVVIVAPQDLADPDRRIARDLRHELRRMSLAQQPDDLKMSALNAAIRSLVAPLQLLGRGMWSEKNSTGHADDVATPNGHNTPQSIPLAIFLQITEAKASIRKAYQPSSMNGARPPMAASCCSKMSNVA